MEGERPWQQDASVETEILDEDLLFSPGGTSPAPRRAQHAKEPLPGRRRGSLTSGMLDEPNMPDAAAEKSSGKGSKWSKVAEMVPARVERFGCRATESFESLNDQNLVKFCQNSAKFS